MYHSKNLSIPCGSSKLDYISFGEGSQPLILIPGLSLQRIRGKAWQMSLIYRIFGKDFKVYMFDRKDIISEGYSIENMADELAQAVVQLSISQADVFGISQGGMIAQALAIRYPKLVKNLVLGVTMARNNTVSRQTVSEWIHLAEVGNSRAIIQNMMSTVYSERFVDKYHLLIAMLARLTKVKELDRFIILARSILAFDVYDELNNIQCPTLVLGGKVDKVLGGDSSLELADKLGCQYYLYEELGHSAYMEAKDFNQRVLAFLLNHK